MHFLSYFPEQVNFFTVLYFWMMHSAVASPSDSAVLILQVCVVPISFCGHGFSSQLMKMGQIDLFSFCPLSGEFEV